MFAHGCSIYEFSGLALAKLTNKVATLDAETFERASMSDTHGQYGSGQHGQGQYGSGEGGQGQPGSGQHGSAPYSQGQYGQGSYGRGQYGRSGYVQPEAGQRPTDWSAPGADGGRRPWEHGMGGAPLAPLQPAPPPRSRWTPPVLPLAGQNYTTAYRPLQKRWGRWFAACALALGFFMFGQVPAMIWMMPMMFNSATGAAPDLNQFMNDLMSSPWILVLTNISWAIMIPGSIIAMAVYGPRAWRFVLSVTGKWRWDVVGKSFALIGPFFALYIGTMLFFSFEGQWVWNPNWVLVFIVLLTTPLQSAGEEFFFRGFLSQQIASWIPRPVVGAIVSGLVTGIIFGAMHMHGFTLPTLQLMFVGFTCSLLTWRTGGLEAASVLHICNNVFIMLPLAFMGYSALDPEATGAGAEPSFAAEAITFAMAMTAMGLSYLAVHFGLRKEQRHTDGAPGSEALIGPAPIVGVAPYAAAGRAGYGAFAGQPAEASGSGSAGASGSAAASYSPSSGRLAGPGFAYGGSVTDPAAGMGSASAADAGSAPAGAAETQRWTRPSSAVTPSAAAPSVSAPGTGYPSAAAPSATAPNAGYPSAAAPPSSFAASRETPPTFAPPSGPPAASAPVYSAPAFSAPAYSAPAPTASALHEPGETTQDQSADMGETPSPEVASAPRVASGQDEPPKHNPYAPPPIDRERD